MKILETERLILRAWQVDDLQPLAQINQDPKVMEFFPSVLNLEETQLLINKVNQHFDEHGYSLYAAEKKDCQTFIGFIGLLNVSFDAHFTPAIEIGWRLDSKHWGQGLAPEGAKAVLTHAFESLNLKEIVSFTAEQNKNSRRVMEKIGMQYHPADDFDHPKLDKHSPLRRHVLYRINQK